MSRRRPPAEALLLLFAAGLVLLNYPLLAIFDRPLRLGSIPALHVYLFGVWTLGILAAAWLARRPWSDED